MHRNIMERITRLEASIDKLSAIDELAIERAEDRIIRLEKIIESMGYYIPTHR